MLYEREVLTEKVGALLRPLGGVLTKENFYLAGGTALAIQRGHRISEDLDFFRREDFVTNEMVESISAAVGNFTVAMESKNSLSLRIEGIKVDILRYDYPRLAETIPADGYRMASLEDIAAMKLSAVTNRGSKKDFYDLLELSAVHTFTEMLDFYREKFPAHDAFFVIRSLLYFEDADLEPDPLSLRGQSWEEVKASVRAKVTEIVGE